jgi:imidazole glycerol-phosphate synthase subunit HisH
MVVVVDYGMGNLGSVLKSLRYLNVEAKISESKSDIETASKLILPGVGHFSRAMAKLKDLDYVDVLNKRVLEKKVPVLGICLGMQLLAMSSEEGESKGLGWIDAKIKKFEIEDKLRWKVPQMGWNSIDIQRENILLENIKQGELFYFVHSFFMSCNDKQDILASTDYSGDFTSIVQKNNIFGTQFHPEKSHEQGLELITNFVSKT